jgi:hypothetical protein
MADKYSGMRLVNNAGENYLFVNTTICSELVASNLSYHEGTDSASQRERAYSIMMPILAHTLLHVYMCSMCGR